MYVKNQPLRTCRVLLTSVSSSAEVRTEALEIVRASLCDRPSSATCLWDSRACVRACVCVFGEPCLMSIARPRNYTENRFKTSEGRRTPFATFRLVERTRDGLHGDLTNRNTFHWSCVYIHTSRRKSCRVLKRYFSHHGQKKLPQTAAKLRRQRN